MKVFSNKEIRVYATNDSPQHESVMLMLRSLDERGVPVRKRVYQDVLAYAKCVGCKIEAHK